MKECNQVNCIYFNIQSSLCDQCCFNLVREYELKDIDNDRE